ncbi:MAG TPA: cytochrome c [Actinomycetota bacterium]|jgi:mono/diheme cytochrome c family protein|nr:cytochrome c [Actinomycetota bacterium]
MLALSTTGGIALAIAGGLIALAAIGGLSLRHRTRETGPDIPDAFKPGPSDAALETPLLTKLQGWSVVLLAFFVIWIPTTWIFEPSTNLNQEKELKQLALERGARAVLPFSEENQLGVGCVRCHGPDLTGGVIQSGNTFAFPPNLTTVCGGPNTGHAAIYSVDDIYQVIQEGRNAMPSWSIRFEGALDDQQINDIVTYLVNLSSKNVDFKDNVCLNADASAKALEGGGPDPRDP